MTELFDDVILGGTATREGLVGELQAQGLPLNSFSVQYEAFRVVKSGAGWLFGFSGYNSNSSAQFVQVFDATVLPADGAVPVFVMTAPGASNFSVAWNLPGRSFTQGILLCNSSTGPTKTIGSADCWFDCQYA